jgi:hypothetical protein
MTGSISILKWVTSLTSSRKEQMEVQSDPTLYRIHTKTQRYTGNIAFQNDTFMKVSLTEEKQKVVKILKENIQKVEILNSQ